MLPHIISVKDFPKSFVNKEHVVKFASSNGGGQSKLFGKNTKDKFVVQRNGKTVLRTKNMSKAIEKYNSLP